MVITKAQAKSKGLSKYFTGKACKRGHISERYTANSDCVKCSIDRAMGVHSGTPMAEVYRKTRERRRKNIEKYREREREYYKDNAEKLRSLAKEDYSKNKDKRLAKSKDWREKNRDKLRGYWREKACRLRSTSEGRLVCNLRSRISSMASRAAGSKTAEQWLGCTIKEFRCHLESLFEDGMDWENYGLTGWQVDHIRPISSFDLSKESEIAAAFHYSNTQPMWAKDNQIKASKWQA